MQDFIPLLNHIAADNIFSAEEQALFVSYLEIKKVKRKQLIEQPGFVSKYRTYIVDGALRAYFIGKEGQEHTLSIAIEDGWIGDPGSFFYREPATLFVEAIEDSTLIQWTYESEQLMLQQIPSYAAIMMKSAQHIAVMMQKRVITHLSMSAEERYEDFANKYPNVIRRMPLYIIASYLGMTREFLSKIRNQRSANKP